MSIAAVGFLLCVAVSEAQLKGTIFSRTSRASNFEFLIRNDGVIWGDIHPIESAFGCTPYWVHWPRGSMHLTTSWVEAGRGLLFLAKKADRYLASYADIYDDDFMPNGVLRTPCAFNQMVPGRIGDQKAGYDTVYQGSGWRYVDDPDYIVYSSLDYDSSGVDRSGSNFNDWPIRSVNGLKKYIAEPLERRKYSTVYVSGEDMFCVFKDTDTRADFNYKGMGGPSEPIGIEIHHYVFSWGSGPLKDIVLFEYKVINKSGSPLDSCYFVFCPDLVLAAGDLISSRSLIPHSMGIYSQEPWRNLCYVYPIYTGSWEPWIATPIPPTIGYALIESPRAYDGTSSAPARIDQWDQVSGYLDQSGKVILLSWEPDSIVSYATLHPHPLDPRHYDSTYKFRPGPALITGPYPMQPNDTATTTIAFIFSDSLPHLLLLDDLITKVYNSGFQRPSPPPPPKLKATGLDRSVKLSWDNAAESATDPIVPDSLGKPFKGYRLLRARSKEGPYVEIGRWTKDSTLIYEYLDNGKDIGGLKNNVRYYYRILSFDEGAKLLKLDPMESKPIDGVNAQSVIPSSEPLSANESLERVQVVPNPYMVTHEAQRGSPRLYFNYLPEECTIRIYTIALDLVKTLTHNGGSREEWDLTTEGGQLVASQLLFAYIEATNGMKTIKKFSVVVGK